MSVRRGFRALVGDRLWSGLLDLGVAQRHQPGSFLLRQGEAGGFLLVLVRGRVTVLGHDGDGAELLVALRSCGDLVGEMAGDGVAVRSASVQAVDPCVVRNITMPVFRQFLAANRAEGQFADYLVAKLSETIPYQMRLVHFSAQQRLARLLLELVALADSEHPDYLRIPFSQERLARSLGLARSTVAEQLAVLRGAGVLRAGRRLVVADPVQLAKYAGM